MTDTREFTLWSTDATVHFIGEASGGDPASLLAIKAWIRKTAADANSTILHMDDSIAVVETPMVITIKDTSSLPASAVASNPIPSHFLEADEG